MLSKFNSKGFFALIPILPILVFLFITDAFYYDINELKSEYLNNIRKLETQKKTTVRTIILNRISQAKIQNHNMSIELKKCLNEEYNNDKFAISNDIENNILDNKLRKVFIHVLNKDHEMSRMYDTIEPDHIVFISNKYGIIELTNKNIANRSFISYKKWKEIVDSKNNKDLTDSAIHGILNMTEDIIIWESNLATIEKFDLDAQYKSSGIKTISHLINNNQENIFKYYSVIVPTYVSINKEPDDIIILREINLFNIIEPYIYSINKYNAMVEDYKYDMSKLIFLKIMACVTLTVTLLGSFFLALFSAFEKSKEKR